MLTPSCRWIWLLVLALLALATTADAAPAPATRPELDSYLLDDTDFVLVINVRQILAAPLFTRHYRKSLQGFLESDAIKPWLEGAGFDPLRDVERLILVAGRSSHPTEKDDGAGPLIYLKGRFDAEKIRVTMDRLAERMPGILKAETRDGVKGYHLTAPEMRGFVCLLDRHTLFYTQARKGVIADARARVTAKKKTVLKNKALQALLGRMKPEQAITIVSLGEMVLYSMVRIGGGARKVTVHTLADEGIDSIQGGITLTDSATGQATLTVKNEEQAKRMASRITAGLNAALDEIQKGGKTEPQTWAALITMVEGVRIRASGRTVVLEGRVTAEKLKVFTGALFGDLFRAPSAPPPARP